MTSDINDQKDMKYVLYEDYNKNNGLKNYN
jgi:hypothetical protein